MGLSNNDFNWRGVCGEAIPENCAVKLHTNGKLMKAADTGDVHGIAPQAYASGERGSCIRGGTLSGLVGFTAGARLKVQADGSLATAGTGKQVAIVKAEDATTAAILSGAFDT